MVDVKLATEQLSELTLLNYFPQNEHAQDALVRMVCERAKSDEQIAWLVARILELHTDWPGPATIMRLFDSPMMPGNMKPLSEADRLKIASADRLLTDGPEPAPDPTLESDVRQVLGTAARMKSAVTGFSAKTTAEEIQTAPEWLRKLEGYE